MNRRPLGLALIAALLLHGAGACAKDDAPATDKKEEETQRLCKDEDLVGHLFKMVYFRETPQRRETEWAQAFPHHFLAFHPKNGYGSMAFNREFKDPKKVAKYVTPSPAKYYSLSKGGILTLIDNDVVQYSYRCLAILKRQSEYMPGDLVLTGYTKKGKSMLYKLYRRWY